MKEEMNLLIEVEETKEFIQEFENLHIFDSVIRERISFRRAAINGMSVTEFKPEDNKAIEEMMNLYGEIYK